MSWVGVVDEYLAELRKAGAKAFTAADLDLWLRTHYPNLWGNASFMLQQHKLAMGRGRTKEHAYCTRRGPWAPWLLQHPGSGEQAMDIKSLQLLQRDLFLDYSCRAMSLALEEDRDTGHGKKHPSDPDGPALAAVKGRITNIGFSVNAVLVALGQDPVDVPGLLARF